MGHKSAALSSRWGAALVHLSISAALACIMLAALFLVWYPGPLFEAQGGQGLFLLLTGIDVTIGPLITLLIFKPGKKGLRFDLAVVALLQLAAFSYGAWTAFSARPAFLAFHNDWFEVVPAYALEPQMLADAPYEEFRSVGFSGPRLIVTQMPTSPDEEARALMSAMAGYDITYYPKYYLPYSPNSRATLRKSRAVADLRALNPAEGGRIDRFLDEHGRSDATVRYLPVRTRGEFLTAMLDAESGEFLGLLALRPW
jgi:hypothetical protein